ncbi:MAG TPA: DNA (cytosine-5-)-methyltransferase [Candidatus Dormibacteraeota bacterium]|nr:DNA (cytosine-5-)-methyltransferase [Candidatus Dormibacteraeota bacterium]
MKRPASPAAVPGRSPAATSKGNLRPCPRKQRSPASVCPPIRHECTKPTLGSLFAGIGGIDLGFERAGWRTAWQVEINPVNRAVLAHRFPDAARFEDVRRVGSQELARVDCIAAGFPCQDISTAGGARKDRSKVGLRGERSGLFFEVIRILKEVQPAWVVLENVAALLSSNDCQDFQVVIGRLADCGYVGFWRVLNSQYFGIPQRRRRVFLVAGLGRYPTIDLLADSAPVEAIPSAMSEGEITRSADAFALYTLSAKKAACQIQLGGEVLVAEQDGWGAMVERERSARLRGLSLGLDGPNLARHFGAGNAVSPPVAEWIGRALIRSQSELIRDATGGGKVFQDACP